MSKLTKYKRNSRRMRAITLMNQQIQQIQTYKLDMPGNTFMIWIMSRIAQLEHQIENTYENVHRSPTTPREKGKILF